MGVWATGLYAGDFALDLRSTIGAVAKLPFDGDRLLDILCESERAAADRSDDPDHSTFWLVVADQWVRERIIVPTVRAKPREVMRNAQLLLMQTGDVLVYPTFGGRCRNPYFVDQDKDRMGTASRPWQIDSWAAMVIVDSGRAFDFLAWYRPLTLAMAMAEKPSIVSLKGDLIWKLGRPGTCSAPHFKRMGIEKIGSIAIDRTKLRACFGELPPGTSAAVSDISIANQINAGPYVSEKRIGEPGNLSSVNLGRLYSAIAGLMQVAES